jgi:lysophospholipase L1-like esterase
MDHEGHWGWRADEVLVKIDGWAEQAAPDIVLLHLGTNDILQMQDNKDTVVELRQIILVLRKHNPRVEILLAQLIPLAGTTANVQVQKLNGLLPDMAQSITTDDSPVHIVNQYEGFDAFKDTNDGIHPNESGIVKMAQRWHEALSDRLKSQR